MLEGVEDAIKHVARKRGLTARDAQGNVVDISQLKDSDFDVQVNVRKKWQLAGPGLPREGTSTCNGRPSRNMPHVWCATAERVALRAPHMTIACSTQAADYFDVCAGTSTGSIIATYVASKGSTADKLHQLPSFKQGAERKWTVRCSILTRSARHCQFDDYD